MLHIDGKVIVSVDIATKTYSAAMSMSRVEYDVNSTDDNGERRWLATTVNGDLAKMVAEQLAGFINSSLSTCADIARCHFSRRVWRLSMTTSIAGSHMKLLRGLWELIKFVFQKDCEECRKCCKHERD